jgi:HAD superfamily hydrolase (TIGR01509 family)
LLKAIIFDFDGLMIDTEAAVFQTWQEIYREYAQEIQLESWQAAVGTQESPFDPRQELNNRVGRQLDWGKINIQQREREIDLVASMPLLPGVQAHLEFARQAGYRLGVASSSYHDWVDYHLAQRSLRDYFSTVKCADDVRLTKPDPELYLAALADLEVQPQEAIALEDSPAGALAASRAGLFTIVIPNEITRTMEFMAGDLHLDSLGNITPQDLLASVQSRLNKNGKHTR